jgi:shikimate kinase
VSGRERTLLDRHLVVVGMMGAGKTTLGRALAERLSMPYLDSDDELLAKDGRSGRDLAASEGVGELHRREGDILLVQLASTEGTVISAAASTLDRPECVDAMKAHLVVWVDVPLPELAARAATGDHRRPMDADELNQRWGRRRPILETLGACRVDGSTSLEQQVSAVLDYLDSHGGTV